ncbi:thyroid hormone receptor beta-like [Penaeus monodon]|uniref:thyroid hormone receptor beta-like n=1 Tax=Penaeus monodon TaxID=6687 RepID=UPI0018A768E7|nr:thyroid hormone receptor beta-like [Penaeus monodon]XP_037778232.1 thyroid hormone receptor beta-like [Penaeus monodon]XP_037778233.1 thyroid hormone receptor beta-like [Penaeus monodon]
MEYQTDPFGPFLPPEELVTPSTSPEMSPRSSDASRSPPNVWLPSYMSPGEQCAVCGDSATGFHYRAMTCEGCKGFFRRTIQRRLTYSCRHGGTCVIDRSSRNACQHCRYLRCLSAGMAPAHVLNEKQRVAKRQLVEENRERRRGDPVALPVETLGLHTAPTSEDKAIVTAIAAAYHDVFSKPAPCTTTVTEVGESGPTEEDGQAWTRATQILAPSMARVVAFVKSIPGFSTLSTNDQLVLLRGCVLEVLFLRTALRYNPATKALPLRNGRQVCRSQVQTAMGGALWALVHPMFELGASVARLHLSSTEAALLTALVALQTDRPGLTDMESVEAVQDSLLVACKRYVATACPDQPIRWAKLVMKVTHIRSIASEHADTILSGHSLPNVSKLLIHLFQDTC